MWAGGGGGLMSSLQDVKRRLAELRKASGPVGAAFAADLHLWHRPPPCRTGEPDWYAAQRRHLDVLRYVADNANGRGAQVPLMYVGDVLDRWNVPAELLSWAIQHLPPGFAVPGMNDLPGGDYARVKESAYYVLVRAGVLRNLPHGRAVGAGPLRLHGFPYGCPVIANDEPNATLSLDVAVAHSYVWCGEASRPGERPRRHYGQCADALKGYAAAVFGGNHRRFVRAVNGIPLINCGAFLRRLPSEGSLTPSVSLLHEDGKYSSLPLDLTGERFDPDGAKELDLEVKVNFEVFLESMRSLVTAAADKREALADYMTARGVHPSAKGVLLAALGGVERDGDDDED